MRNRFHNFFFVGPAFRSYYFKILVQKTGIVHQSLPSRSSVSPTHRPPRSRKTFKYAHTVVDVASRYKEAEPLTTKEAKEVAAALERIYSHGPLKWPKLLQVDPGRGFMGAVNQLLSKHNVEVRRGRVDIHRDQAIVERFNRTLAERLFGYQYAVEMRLPEGQQSTAWVKRLPEVVAALNNELTSVTGKKPAVAIKEKDVSAKPSTPYSRPVGQREKNSPLSLMCAISTKLASLKVVLKEPQIQSGL